MFSACHHHGKCVLTYFASYAFVSTIGAQEKWSAKVLEAQAAATGNATALEVSLWLNQSNSGHFSCIHGLSFHVYSR